MDCDKVDDSVTPEEGEKRQKKRKISHDVHEKLPNSAIEGLKEELVEELQLAYMILQTILSMSRIDPFLVKPDSSLFGLSTYYSIIKKPMWLDEIYRKLLEREYTCISQFIADIRLMLENCYRFWGSSHKFTRKGLRIEQKLEQKIDSLPLHVRKKCIAEDGCSGELVVKSEDMEVVEESEKTDDSNFQEFSANFKGFQSKILNRVLESESNEVDNEMTSEAQQDREAQMLSWEKDTLVTDEIREQIKSMWQLAEIGHFLKLTYEILNVEEIPQYEIERMLIMPRESLTLATLMTSMLSPATIRGNLDITPVMPYEVWTNRLKKRMDDWFSVFYKKCNFLETYNVCGIDPHFWLAMALQNPLDETSFHDLTLFQRVWILKSLCNYLLHTNKCIQDLFSDETNLSEMRCSDLGQDNDGFSYFHLPFFPEIRVYKQKLEEKAQYWPKLNIIENLVVRTFDASVSYTWDDFDLTMTISPNEKQFYTVADNMESLKELHELVKKDSTHLSKAIAQFIKEAKKYRQNNEGLDALYTQWCDYQKRPTDYQTNSLSSWESGTSRGNKNNEPEKVLEVLGKRRSKLNLSFLNMEMETSDEFDVHESESDISDWESDSKKKKKTNRKTKTSENHELPEENKKVSEDKHSEVENKIIDEFTVDYSDIKPNDLFREQSNNTEATQEIEVKPVISKDGVVTEQLVPYINQSINSQQSKPKAKKAIQNIKQEKEDDVISISSEEELDVKPNINLLNVKTTPQKPVNIITQPMFNSPSVMGVPRMEIQNITLAQPNMMRMPQQVPQMRNAWPQPIQMNQNSPRPGYLIQAQPGMPSPTNMQPQPSMQPSPNMKFNMMQQNVPRPQVPGLPMTRTRAPSPMQQLGVRTRSPYTPRQRSPIINSPGQRPGLSPRGMNSMRGARMPPRNLFPVSPRPPREPTLEGILEVGQKSDGSFGYHVRLPDGGIINLSRTEVDEIRKKNNGTLPHRVEVPRVKKPPSPILLR